MACIAKGDMLVTREGRKAIALGPEYDRRIRKNSEYLDDFVIVPSVSVIFPDSGDAGPIRLVDLQPGWSGGSR
jgi:hypothetical protein